MQKKVLLFLTISFSLLLISATIDLNNLFNYSDQSIPDYITKDNTPGNNQISDPIATLGRVLFYDKNLSANNTISCSSCHKQEFAFTDTAALSVGLNGGLTGRSSMRLINSRFADENRFFWDERANSLEIQATMPIQDHIEMGFSGANGDPDFDSLIVKLEDITYYQDLFEFAFGNTQVTEMRMRRALAQFIRSIQSFDSRFDEGLAQVNAPIAPFPNFTPSENAGKNLFFMSPQNGGANCNICHRAPEFDIVPNSGNNGVIAVAGQPGIFDLTNTKSPSLRDMVNPNGTLNGPLMHDGSFTSLMQVIDHYNLIVFDSIQNPDLDLRLRGGPTGLGQDLQLSTQQKENLVAFLGTLTGSNVYTDERWSDPFDANGDLTIIPLCQSSTSTIMENICDGEDFEGYTQSGTYEDILINAQGCDSIRTLVLEVHPNPQTQIIAEVCEGESFEGYTQTGVYTDFFTSAFGCDSTRTLALLVLSNEETIINVEICEGENFEGYTESGTYTDIYTASNGCDSIQTLNLVVLPDSDPNCISTAITEQESNLEVTLSPNPFDESINIQCEFIGTLEISIYNSIGQKVQSEFVTFQNNYYSIPTEKLLPGIYIISGFDHTGNKYFSQKVLKVD